MNAYTAAKCYIEAGRALERRDIAMKEARRDSGTFRCMWVKHARGWSRTYLIWLKNARQFARLESK